MDDSDFYEDEGKFAVCGGGFFQLQITANQAGRQTGGAGDFFWRMKLRVSPPLLACFEVAPYCGFLLAPSFMAG